MAAQYAYNYAQIDETGFCYGVLSTSRNNTGVEGYIEIPVYSDEYMGKYYNIANSTWYTDAAFTNEWQEPTE